MPRKVDTSHAVRSRTSAAVVAAILLLLALAGMPGGLGFSSSALFAGLAALFGLFLSYLWLMLVAIGCAFVDGPRRRMWRVVAVLMLSVFVAVTVKACL